MRCTRRACVVLLVPLAVWSVAVLLDAQARRLARDESLGERRLALVIGNDAYPRMPLRNAVNDASSMAAALTRVGFDVRRATNTSFKELNQSIDRFVGELRRGDIALVYYAGHGIQIEGENFLLPIDFDAQDETDAKYEGYSASRLAERLPASGAQLSVLVFDACRDNPFRASRSGSRGLASMNGATGSLIAFATAPGRTADDNLAAGNGLFTQHLLRAIETPGLTIEQVFSVVREDVYRASDGRQVPWTVSSVIGQFSFVPARETVVPPRGTPAPGNNVNTNFVIPARPGSETSSTAAPAANRLTFDGRTAIWTVSVIPGRERDYEDLIRKVGTGLTARGSAAQAQGWRLYRGTALLPDGKTPYVHLLDPVVAGADYSTMNILYAAFPESANENYERMKAAFSANLSLALGEPVFPAAGRSRRPVPAAEAPKDALTFDGDIAVWAVAIKPDRTGDFQYIIRRLRDALQRSSDPVRASQLNGWGVVRLSKPLPDGNVAYVHTIDPVVRNADYTILRILHEAFPSEQQHLYDTYRGAFGSNLSLFVGSRVAVLGTP